MITELPRSCDLSTHVNMLFTSITLLRIFVALNLLPHRQWQASTSNKRSKPEEHLMQCMGSLVEAVISFGIRLCKEIDIFTDVPEVNIIYTIHLRFTDHITQHILITISRLLKYAEYLIAVGIQDRLDHSAVYVASQWFMEYFREPNLSLIDIEVHAKALADAVTLTSGLGLSEIWSSLSTSTGQDAQTSKLNRLDDVASRLPESRRSELSSTIELEITLTGTYPDIRPRIFDLMNLEAVQSTMSETERKRIKELTTQLQTVSGSELIVVDVLIIDQQLADLWLHETHTPRDSEAHPMYLVAELMHIASLDLVNGPILSEVRARI